MELDKLVKLSTKPNIKRIILGFYLIVTFFLMLGFQDYPYFWDSIQLGSKHGHWYYEQDFKFFFLPAAIDSGHPPFFGMFTALSWKLFGKNLLVSHWIFFPFLIWSLYLSWKIAQAWLSPPWALFLPGLLLLDPVFSSQALLMGPDLLLVNFFLLSLFGLLKEKKLLLLFGVIGLSLISMRGMMCAFALFLFELFNSKTYQPYSLIKSLWFYIPGALLALSFLYLHYQHSGWIGYHEDSPWAGSFARVDFIGFIKNGIILFWRILDFGRIALIAVLAFLLIRFRPDNIRDQIKTPLLITTFLFFILAIPMLLYKGVNQHRYLLPLFLLLSFLFLIILEKSRLSSLKKMLLFILVGLVLFSGNYWIYPEKIAQGWDSTLAHRPYYELQKKALSFLENEQIDLQEVGTTFPALGALKFQDLQSNHPGFQRKNLDQNRYIFYSNIMNDFSDQELDELYRNWSVLFQARKKGVKVIIFGHEKVETSRAEPSQR